VFFGDNSYVATGSDCGNLFIWEKHSGKLVQLLKADEHVVNGVAPHPLGMPVLATCGIDSDAKVFDVGQSVSFSPRKAESAVETNTAPVEERPNIFQLWDLIAGLQNRGRGREEDNSDDDDDDEEDFDEEEFEAEMKIKQADDARLAANAYFRNARYVEAADLYTDVLNTLSFEPPNESITDRQQRSQLFCHLNRAACNLKLANNDLVIEDCNLVLEKEPTNVKALVRRGTALMNKEKYTEAKVDLIAATKLSPEDATITKLIQDLEEKVNEPKKD